MINKIMGKIENRMFSVNTDIERINLILSFFALLVLGCFLIAGVTVIIENMNTFFREISINGIRG